MQFFHNSNVFVSCIIRILYNYSTNIGTEFFEHVIFSQFFLQNAVCFIIVTYLFPVLFTFHIFIQQIYVLNFLNMLYTLSFFLQNAVCFIILTYLFPLLFNFIYRVF